MNKYKLGKVLLGVICIWTAIHTPNYTHEMWSIEKTYFNPDVLLYSEELRDAVPDDEQCIILNDMSGYIFSYRIDKMGHVFDNDQLPLGWIKDMVQNYGIKYMYSDSKNINENIDFQKFIDETILVKGTVKVFKLKLPDSLD